MAPTPADLEAAADALRRSARFLALAFAPVGPRSDGQTWEGPAATSFRHQLAVAERRVAEVDHALRARAAQLERRAAHLRAARVLLDEVRWAWEQALDPSPSVFADAREGR